jgi:hypothetical protein
MAKTTNNTNTSLVATLSSARANIFRTAQVDDERNLSPIELAQLRALECVIANSAAETRRDAAVQVAIALERVEAFLDGSGSADMLHTAYAALRSASAVLCPSAV